MTKTYELANGKMIMADVDEKHHTATVSVYALDDLVEAVNKTGHWILVSERLPKTQGVYNVTRLIDEAYITDSCFYDGNAWYDDTRINHGRKYLHDVVAWMPLPEPYTKREDKE